MSPMLQCNDVQEAELRVGPAFLCVDSLPLSTKRLRGPSYWQLVLYCEATLGKTLASPGPQGLIYELKE